MDMNQKRKFSFFRINAFLLVLLGCLFFFLTNCKKPTTEPEEEMEEIKEEIKMLTTFNATYTLEGTEATGTVRYVGNDKDVTVNIGEQADLGTTPEGTTRYITVYVNGDSALQRIFKNVPMPGTTTYTTDVLNLSGFNFDDFIGKNDPTRRIPAGDGVIQRLKPPQDGKLSVYFNPDYSGTGKRLPLFWIEETERIWNQIKENSNGEIVEINFIRNGEKDNNDTVGQGEIFVFEDTKSLGVSAATWQNNDRSVYGIKLFFNSTVPVIMAEYEIIDSLFQSEQNGLAGRWNWVKFVFKRPAGNNYGYRIYEDHEEEEGFTEGVSGSIEEGALVKVLVKYEEIPDPTAPFRFFRNMEDNFITIKRIIREIPNKNIRKKDK